MERARPDIELSVIIVSRDYQDGVPVHQLYSDYKHEIEKTGLRHEFIFVVAGDYPSLFEDLRRLKEQEGGMTIIKFATWHGAAAAQTAGFDHASGDILLTLPAYHQIDPQAIPSLVTSLAGNDMVVVRRWPRVDRWINRLQTSVFHYLLRKATGLTFRDLGCGVRLFKRRVSENVYIYGDQERFFPVLASRSGFRVKEVDLPQATADRYQGHFPSGVYIRRLLDLLSIFFLVKFTRKPLRFFGLTGLFMFTVGAVFTVFLAIQRMFMGVALADRPVLLLGLLSIVLGIQFFAIGLIGELIIFIHARDVKDYMIEEIVN